MRCSYISFPELCRKKEQMEKRQEEIYLDYPQYYNDECLFDKISEWFTDFYNQISDKKQKSKIMEKYQEILLKTE